ncbi:MAG: prolyl oligopeptidase family serine peptidase, partial [Anaerolineae bacterium]
MAVLLPDKRGSVKAGGDWHTSSYEDLATDSVAAIDYLKGQDLVDVSAIGLIGMSQGGQLAPLVVHQAPDVAFLLDVVGTSLSSYDVLYYEETNNLRELGFLPGISDLIAYPSTYVLRKFTQRDFWDAVGDFDALPYWQELSIPTLVMYGSDDPNVPARASKARLDALDKENITVKIYEGSGHALQDPPGRGNRIFRQEALDDIVDFIGSVVPLPITFAEPRFVFQGDDPSVPIVTHDPSPEIENRYINPGALLFHDGQYHMFFNSFTLWPGVVQVGHMASADGVRWQMVQDAPVFATDQIPFGRGKADVSSVVVMDDGTWTMYFHTVSEGEIGLATASSPLGPWTVRPEPVLGPGPSGAWDQNGLGWPDVVRDGDDYFMFYGAQGQGGYAIGLATSSDGFHWTKYDDTETGEEPLAESDPVLTAAAKWESNRVDRPRVVLSPDGWVMLYQGGPFVDRRGLAMSNDGVHWETYAANPIFSREVFPI